MHFKKKFRLSVILTLNLVLLACSFITRALPALAPTPTSTPTATVTHTPSPTFTPKPTNTPFYPVRWGDTIRLPSGGFRFYQIKGYTVVARDNIGARLKSRDKNVELDIVAYPRPRGKAISGLLDGWGENFAKKFDEIAYADPVTGKEGSMESISADFSGVENGIPFQGRMAIYESPNTVSLIYLLVVAYGDQRWQREGREVFESTADSIVRFEVTPLSFCPTTKNPLYGYAKDQPIPIGGGAEDGVYRIYAYLGTLLGKDGKIVAYDQASPETYNGVELRRFLIRVGNTFDTLYFDVNTYADLFVPYNLTCSAPLPGKPFAGSSS